MTVELATSDPLLEAMGALWPHADVRRTSRADRAQAGRAGVSRTGTPQPAAARELVVVPGGGGSGTALPLSPNLATARSLRRISAAASTRHIAARMTLAGLSRLGLAGALSERIEISGSGEASLQELFGGIFGEPVTFSVAVGTARVNRKPVLEVFAPDGRSLGFAKVGLGPVARADVVAETEALRSLVGMHPAGLTVPRVIWSGVWQGAPVLMMSGVPRSVRQRHADRAHPPEAEMRGLVAAYAEPAMALSGSAFLAGVEQTMVALADAQRRSVAARCLTALVRRASGPVPMSAWHGDWTPWNMARHREGLSLWDWERFETGVPAGLDRLHYLVNVATTRHGTSPAVVRRALTAAGEKPLLSGLYLAAISSRYLRLAAGPGGEVLAPRADCFLEVWDDWSR